MKQVGLLEPLEAAGERQGGELRGKSRYCDLIL